MVCINWFLLVVLFFSALRGACGRDRRFAGSSFHAARMCTPLPLAPVLLTSECAAVLETLLTHITLMQAGAGPRLVPAAAPIRGVGDAPPSARPSSGGRRLRSQQESLRLHCNSTVWTTRSMNCWVSTVAQHCIGESREIPFSAGFPAIRAAAAPLSISLDAPPDSTQCVRQCFSLHGDVSRLRRWHWDLVCAPRGQV